MSESQVNHNSQNQNPPAAGSAPAGGTPPDPAAQTQNTTPHANKANGKAQFESSQIGIKTTKQHDPFAEQNAKRAKKNAEDAKKLKKVLIILIPIFVILVAALVIWLIVRPPKQSDAPEPEETVYFSPDNVSENVAALQQLANNALNRKPEEAPNGEITLTDGDMAAANEVFDTVLETPGNEAYANEINLTRMNFYVINGDYEAAIAVRDDVDVNSLSGENKFLYYNILYLAYSGIGDEDAANQYMQLQTNALIEFNGGGQG